MKRITSIPGVTVLPFIQAPKYSPGAMREVRAIAWHFAQGGGTDTWLTRKDGAQGNNSCHIVLKYNGSIRQIVEFDDASWSLHISYDSGTNDAPDYGIFSLQHVKNALGAGWSDPNRYIVAIEVEGFYQDGPNAAQKVTIDRLARFLEGEFPKAVHLGHRDFQDYKPCPGPTLFRGLLPHHSRLTSATPTPTEEAVNYRAITTISPKLIDVAIGNDLFDLDGTTKLFDNKVAREGILSPFGCGSVTIDDKVYRFRAFYLDADGDGDRYHRQLTLVRVPDAQIYELPTAAPIDPNPQLQADLAEAQADLAAIRTIVNEAA